MVLQHPALTGPTATAKGAARHPGEFHSKPRGSSDHRSVRRRWGELDFLRYETRVIPMGISPFAIPAVTIIYDSVVWYVKTDGK